MQDLLGVHFILQLETGPRHMNNLRLHGVDLSVGRLLEICSYVVVLIVNSISSLRFVCLETSEHNDLECIVTFIITKSQSMNCLVNL